jgi:hypothetical protein
MLQAFTSFTEYVHQTAATKVTLVCDFNENLASMRADPQGSMPLGTWHLEVRMPLLDALAPPRYCPSPYAIFAVATAYTCQPLVDLICGALVSAAALVVGCRQGTAASRDFLQGRKYCVFIFAAALCCSGLACIT